MIFNPLFIGENGNSQSLVPKSGRLSNNKYLFSDIVKVVMNPVSEQKPIISTDISQYVNELNSKSDQKLVKLNYNSLIEHEKEHESLELADILPEDIAKLLVNEETIVSNEKAVSYISKEPLSGELQNFLHNLIGTEIIDKNISDKSGLLLNLEDRKSAVNIELVKNLAGKSTEDKILVQTLVIPEKSKLLSFFGNKQNQETLFRTTKSTIDKLNSAGNGVVSSNGNSEIHKPILSVYSFSHNGNEADLTNNGNNINNVFKHNLNLISNSNLKSNTAELQIHSNENNIALSKLKGKNLTGELKDIKPEITGRASKENLKIINQNKFENDYSVRKITIVKKQNETDLLSHVKSKKDIPISEFESALRRIDFNKKMSDQKSPLHLVSNIKNKNEINKNSLPNNPETKNSESNNKISFKTDITNQTVEKASANTGNKNTDSELKVSLKLNEEAAKKNVEHVKQNVEITKTSDKPNSNNELNQGKNISSKSSEQKADITNQTVEKASPNIGNKNTDSELKVSQKFNEDAVKKNVEHVKHNIEITKTTEKPNSNNDLTQGKNISNKSSDQKTEFNTLLNSKNKEVPGLNIGETTKVAKAEQTEKTIVPQEKQKVEELNNSQQKIQEVLIENEKGLKGFVKSSNLVDQESKGNYKPTIETSENKSSLLNNKSQIEINEKQEIKNPEQKNIIDAQTKEVKPDNKKESIILEELAKVGKNENSAIKAGIENAVNINNENSRPIQNNKKFSVKVKGGVKTVTDQNDSKPHTVDEQSTKENTSNSSQSKSENSESNSFKSSTIHNSHFEIKNNNENTFNQMMNKSEILGNGIGGEKTSVFENKTEHRIVKSIEMIKELAKFISKQEKGSLSFDIRPEHLGKMKITLDTVDKMLKASIEVDNEQTKQLVEKNLDKLQQQLSENGVMLNSLNISLKYAKQQKEDKKINKNIQNDNENSDQVGGTEEGKNEKSLGYNTYEYIA